MYKSDGQRMLERGLPICRFCGRGEKILSDGSSVCLHCNPQFKEDIKK